jgi:hypothetical protein
LLKRCGGTVLTKHHNGSQYSLWSFPPKGKSLVHYGTLKGSHQNCASFGGLHNLIRGFQDTHCELYTTTTELCGTTKPLNRLGFQEPETNKLRYKHPRVISFSNFTNRIFVETSNRCTKLERTQKVPKSFSPKIPPQKLVLWSTWEQ